MIPTTITRKRLALAASATLFAGATFALGADPPKDASTEDAATKDASTEAAAPDRVAAPDPEGAPDEGGGLQAAKFMPLGKPNLRVRIPQFKDGVLECVMRAEEMTRVGDDLIDIKTMDIEFVEDGAPTMTIELAEATYNLTDQLISSDRQAVVRRADFTLVGDSLDFDTVKRHGRMTGKVRMVIHDASGFVGGDEDEESGEAETVEGDIAGGISAALEVPSGPWVARVTLDLAATLKGREKQHVESDDNPNP